jgi:hypothetical protein
LIVGFALEGSLGRKVSGQTKQMQDRARYRSQGSILPGTFVSAAYYLLSGNRQLLPISAAWHGDWEIALTNVGGSHS